MAGHSDLEATESRAAESLTDNAAWGFDESLWEMFGVRGQPTSFMITADGFIADAWSGILGEKQLREKFEALVDP